MYVCMYVCNCIYRWILYIYIYLRLDMSLRNEPRSNFVSGGRYLRTERNIIKIYTYRNTYVYQYQYLYIYIPTSISIYMHTNVHRSINQSILLCMYVCMHVWMDVSIHRSICLYIWPVGHVFAERVKK